MTIVQHVLPEISSGIFKAAKGQKPKRSRRGVQAGTGSGPTKIPAEHILDMRRRHELHGQCMKSVCDAYPQYSYDYVYGVLTYKFRSSLMVKR